MQFKRKMCITFFVALLVLPLSYGCSSPQQQYYSGAHFSVVIVTPTQLSTIPTDGAFVGFRVENVGPNVYVDSMPVTCYFDGQLLCQGKVGISDINNVRIACAGGSVELSGLTEGDHLIQVKCKVHGHYYAYGTPFEVDAQEAAVNFYVNLHVPPAVSIKSLPKYSTDQVSINITTNVANSIVSYQLDNHATVKLAEQSCSQYNVTLSDLPNGNHTFTAFAKDKFGNVGSTEKNFTVNNTTPRAAYAFSALAIYSGAAIIVVVLGCCLILLFYKKPTSEPESSKPEPEQKSEPEQIAEPEEKNEPEKSSEPKEPSPSSSLQP
jgi:hypothetical protein